MAGNLLLAGVPFNDYGVGEWVGAVVMYGVLGWLQDVRSGGGYKRPSLVRTRLISIRPVGTSRRRADGTRPGSRNRLIPMQLADRVHRLTGWDRNVPVAGGSHVGIGARFDF